jgi:hypothetical protein
MSHADGAREAGSVRSSRAIQMIVRCVPRIRLANA